MKITEVKKIIKGYDQDVTITKLHEVCGGVVYEAKKGDVVIYTFTMKQNKGITYIAWSELCDAIEDHNRADAVDQLGENDIILPKQKGGTTYPGEIATLCGFTHVDSSAYAPKYIKDNKTYILRINSVGRFAYMNYIREGVSDE